MRAFARGDPSRSVAGSGLGLSIVQQIAARMAGRLRFERDADGHHARVSLDVRRTVDPRPIAPGMQPAPPLLPSLKSGRTNLIVVAGLLQVVLMWLLSS